ncbi:MAG: hypothetical protein HXS48_10250 [Theionarchaea archaeon]|nr:hypothetical protein [Theionarchaea archaeon]
MIGSSHQCGAIKVYLEVKHHWSIIPHVTEVGSPTPMKFNNPLYNTEYDMTSATKLKSSLEGIFF